MDSVAYSRLKKFAYEGIANFFILRIYLDFIAILILEIRWVGVCGLFLGLGWLICFSGFERLIVLGCFLFGDLFPSENILGLHRHSYP